MTRRTRRLLRGPAIGATVVLVALLGLPSGVPNASAGTTSVVGSAAEGAATDRIDLDDPEGIELVEISTFVSPSTPFTVGIRLGGSEAGDSLQVSLYPRVSSRIGFTRTLSGDGLGTPLQAFAPVPVASLPVASDGTIRLSLGVAAANRPVGDLELAATDAGIYPLAISRSGSGDTATLITHVVRLADVAPTPTVPPSTVAAEQTEPTEPTFSVAMVIDLTGPTSVDENGSVTLPDADAARLGALADLAVQAPDRLTVRSTGATLRALSDGGATQRPIGQLVTPLWLPVESGSLVAADESAFLRRQLLSGAVAAASATGGSGSSAIWFLDPSVDPDALTELQLLGVQRVVVPEVLLSPLDASEFPTTVTRPFGVEDGTGKVVPAVQTDDGVRRLLTSTDQTALAANRALADLAVLAFDFPDQRRAAVVDVGADVSPGALRSVLDGLAIAASPPEGSEPLMVPRTLAEAFDRADAFGTYSGETDVARPWQWQEPAELEPWPGRLLDVDANSATLAATLVPEGRPESPEATATLEAVNRIVLASGETGLAMADRLALLDDADGFIERSLAAIGLPPQGTVTLTADTGVVPITVENGRAGPARVRVEVASDKLDFPDGSTLDVVLEPGTNRLEVAVQARASGGFPVEIGLTTPDERIVLGEARFTVRSSAISGVGLALSIVAGVFLLVWWGVHLRTARRSRQLIGDSDTPGDEAP